MNFYQLMTAMVLSGFFVSAQADNATDKIRRSLREKMPGTDISQVRVLPYGPMYEVVVNDTVMYTDKTGQIALVGNLYDLNTKTNLTDRRLAEIRIKHVDFASLPLDKAIVTVKGDGARKLAVFSDPDCPFCKKLEQELEGVNDVTIYTFLYPIESLHSDAARKAARVWCAPDRAAAWNDLMRHGKEPAQGDGKCATPLHDIDALARRIHIMGTPGLIFGNGKLFPGLLPKDKIEENLGAPNKS